MTKTQHRFSLDELYLLYSRGKEVALEELWNRTKPDIVLASMLSSWHLRQGNAKAAAECLTYVNELEERALKRQTLRFLPLLRAPLEKEPRVHLLLLVCDSLAYVENALRQLAATDYRNYAVYILDNGSTDGSGEIAARAATYFPEQVPVHVVTMPFNIGRPLGHNWLLSQFDHNAADYIAIGDDDLVSVPSSWMRDMVRTFACFPGTKLVGGKELLPAASKTLSTGVRRLDQFTETVLRYVGSSNMPDVGQADYVDCVDHVIGCLHMYDKTVFTGEVGLFDIRFSPSQYVDVDHHTRMRLAGMPIVYNGLIEFRHGKVTGNQTGKSKAATGNSEGNKHKLLSKFDLAEVQATIERNRQELAARVARYA